MMIFRVFSNHDLVSMNPKYHGLGKLKNVLYWHILWTTAWSSSQAKYNVSCKHLSISICHALNAIMNTHFGLLFVKGFTRYMIVLLMNLLRLKVKKTKLLFGSSFENRVLTFRTGVFPKLYEFDRPDRIWGIYAKGSIGRHQKCAQNFFLLQMCLRSC